MIYTASTEAEAERQLIAFAEKWDKQYPTISRSWMNHWLRVIPFFAFPPEIRKAIYTTNAIESVNMTLRKVIKNHRAFPTDESALLRRLSRNAQHCQKVDDADYKLEACAKPFCTHLRRAISYLILILDTNLLTYPANSEGAANLIKCTD